MYSSYDTIISYYTLHGRLCPEASKHMRRSMRHLYNWTSASTLGENESSDGPTTSTTTTTTNDNDNDSNHNNDNTSTTNNNDNNTY